jgi:tetratricopeptide (TPR) repeat protein
VENARAVFLDDEKEILLRKAPLKGKRTCLECRRLADKGAYEESIKAYKEFVENNRGHYQIDDAYFAIGEIYDEKLFHFPEAVKWYRRLATEYPTGTLAALAKQRIDYLSRYSDYDYKPLQTFERIRKIDYARKKDQPAEQAALLKQVETLLHDYPDSSLAPVIVHWLANRCRQTSPQRALQLYRTLEEKYPDSTESGNVPIEIGETYYGAGQYKEALKAYQTALNRLPHRKKIIEPQIRRTKRNIRRDVLSIVSWAAVLILIVLVFVLKPMGLYFKGGFYFLAFVIMGLLLLFGGWLIREQFPSTRQSVLFALLFACDAVLSAFLSTNFSGKLFGPQPHGAGRKTLKIVTGSLMGILFFIAGFYLIIYYVSVHFLVIFKL